MSENTSPDWWARILGLGGFLVAVISLGMSYRSMQHQEKYDQWQQSVEKEKHEEKLQDNVRLVGQFGEASFDTVPVKGDIRIEIVNMGQEKVYLEQVCIEVDGLSVPAQTKGRTKPALEPGMNAYFTIRDWDFAKHPLSWKKPEQQDYTVLITTTRKTHGLPGNTSEFEMIGTAPNSEEIVDDPWERSASGHHKTRQ
jgi:hypothetical protein